MLIAGAAKTKAEQEDIVFAPQAKPVPNRHAPCAAAKMISGISAIAVTLCTIQCLSAPSLRSWLAVCDMALGAPCAAQQGAASLIVPNGWFCRFWIGFFD
jgi:hypothetical protein